MQNGFLDLVHQAGLVGKLVLFFLLFVSVVTWGIIFFKWRAIRVASKENKKFLDAFWHSKNIEEIFSKSERFARSPVAAVFKSGVKELKKLTGTDAKALE